MKYAKSAGPERRRHLAAPSVGLLSMLLASVSAAAITPSQAAAATTTVPAGTTAELDDFVDPGAAVSIINYGTLTGGADFSASTRVSLSNRGEWDAASSTFTAGSDSIFDVAFVDGIGVIRTSGTVTLDFGAGTDSFGIAASGRGSSALYVGSTAGPSSLILSNLETFRVNGTIVFGDGSQGDGVIRSDGEGNDRISTHGVTYYVAFQSWGGNLYMDANVGGGGQDDCSAAVVADCLDLTGSTIAGRANGSSNIYLNLFGAGSLNRIVLVDLTGGTTDADAFVLASPIPVGEGLFYYRFGYDADRQQFALTGNVGRGAFEFQQVPTATQAVWYSSTGTYFERQADLRNQLDTGGGPGVWLRVNKVITERKGHLYQDFGTDVVIHDLDNAQDTTNLIGGIDLLHASSGNTGFVAGVTAGKLKSEVDFEKSSGGTNLEGTSYGVYATLLGPSYYVDGIVQANKVDVDQVGLWNTGGFGKNKADSVGAQVEAGWRFGLGNEVYLEPLASLSYVSTKFDHAYALPDQAGSIKVDDAKSLRGAVGLRVSGDTDFGPVTLKLSGLGRVWDEFKGENASMLTSNGQDVALGDDFGGAMGEVGGGISVYSANHKISGFLYTSAKFKKDYMSSDTSLGVRVQW